MNLETLRRYCATLPAATRDIKWGSDEVYSVGGRMFAVFNVDGARARTLSFKCEPTRFLELTDQPGIAPAPYLARAHWVQMRPSKSLADAEVKALLRRSHSLVLARLPKRFRDEVAASARPVSARGTSSPSPFLNSERDRPLRHAGNPRPRSTRARDP